MHPISVIGVGISPDDLSRERADLIGAADVLVGGERLLSRFGQFSGRMLTIKSPLQGIFQAIREEVLSGKRVVVLAEGDPGFFGIGRKVLEAFGEDQVILFPNVTSLQAAASRMKKTWDRIKTVSLHGRKDLRPLLRALAGNDLVGVYTDRSFEPGRIAQDLISRGVERFRMWIFENMGEENERAGCYELKEAGAGAFSHPNFLILERTAEPEIPIHFGMEDDLFIHEAGLITKKEIRAVGLSNLQIDSFHTVWDLGAGCGSVSIEASRLAHEGSVFAVEKDPSRVNMIRENVRKMGACGIEVVHGTMPACLEVLPPPDRIFMGGGLGRGLESVRQAFSHLKPGGRMVIHVVLLGCLERVRGYLKTTGCDYSLTQVQVSRSKALAGDERLEPLNPVYIISIVKP